MFPNKEWALNKAQRCSRRAISKERRRSRRELRWQARWLRFRINFLIIIEALHGHDYLMVPVLDYKDEAIKIVTDELTTLGYKVRCICKCIKIIWSNEQ